jgi:CBS domain-containing protein
MEIAMKTELVRDWMTPDPVCAPPDMSLPDAHKLMKDHRIRRLPVLNKKGHLIGIVTRGDIRGAEPSEATSLSIYEVHYLLGQLTLERIMTKNPITVLPDTTLGDAARLMLEHKIAGLPVVTENRVVGIITESDIFRMLVKTWEDEAREALEYV